MLLKAALSRNNAILLIIIIAVAASVSVLSYQYSTFTSNQIIQIASEDIRSNARIEANDLTHSIQNELKSVTSDLYILANSPTVKSQEFARASNLINSAADSTNQTVDFYMWLDHNGKIVWVSNINQTIYQKYKGFDLSYRPYFTVPRATHTQYYSSTIQSNDKIPRLYISYPILNNNNSTDNTSSSGSTAKTFDGIMVAAIKIDSLGNFVKNQLFPRFKSNIAILDRSGNILYSTNNQKQIGKNVIAPDLQSTFLGVISSDSKNSLNGLLNRSLQGSSGTNGGGSIDIAAQNVSTIAYQPITVGNNHFLTLYIIAPHEIATDVSNLAGQQKNFSAFMITIIGVVAFAIAFLVLSWNKRLKMIINTRTEELRRTNDYLVDSNKQLALANEQLDHRDEVQKEFINVAAHELRTPIQPIISLTEILRSNVKDREQHQLLDVTIRNAKRLVRLADDILDVTKIESRSLQLNKHPLKLNDVLSDVVQDYRNEIQKAGGSYNIKLEYIPTHEEIAVEADRHRLTQVISNLLSNAIKFK